MMYNTVCNNDSTELSELAMTSSDLKDHVAVTDDAHKGGGGDGESSCVLAGILHGGGRFCQVLEFIGRVRGVLELLGGCSRHKSVQSTLNCLSFFTL